MAQFTYKEIVKMTEEEKIVATVKALGANSQETAVTMEQIIGSAIEMGLTKDHLVENWEGYKEGDHPWWQKVAPMVGVGSAEAVEAHEEIHLHRMKVKSNKESGRKTNVMVYWYDPFQAHQVVEKKTRATSKKKANVVETPQVIEKVVTLSNEQKMAKAQSSNGNLVYIGGKLYSRPWLEAHPDKWAALESGVSEK